jgi:hypothetical protein
MDYNPQCVTNGSFTGNATGWTVGGAWLYPTTGALSVTYAAAGKTITRGAGSFLTNGFMVGNVIKSTSTNNPGPFTIATVVALVITVNEVLVDEGPVAHTITSDNVNKYADGVTTLSQASVVVSGKRYRLGYQISNWTVGTVTPSIGGATGTARGANGWFEEVFTSSSTAALTFTPTNTSRFTIDNVSVMEYTLDDKPGVPYVPYMPNITGIL